MKANSYWAEVIADVYPWTKGRALEHIVLAIFSWFAARFLAIKMGGGDSTFLFLFLLAQCPGVLYYVKRLINGGGCLMGWIRILCIPILGLIYYPFMIYFALKKLLGYSFIRELNSGKNKAYFYKE